MVQNRKRKRLHASLLVSFLHKKFKKLCFRKEDVTKKSALYDNTIDHA